jgi:hypothetical protein
VPNNPKFHTCRRASLDNSGPVEATREKAAAVMSDTLGSGGGGSGFGSKEAARPPRRGRQRNESNPHRRIISSQKPDGSATAAAAVGGGGATAPCWQSRKTKQGSKEKNRKRRVRRTLPNYRGGERDDSLGRRGSIKDSRGSGATRRTWLLLVESALLPL